ncbi:hypothetical protein BKA69DRAFT_79855 [Paraphysoderma sedebokerense]|nr:hypothetical protein BKA69DRAFT_79855 [Paraphysoderma sedebokerense]
MGGLIGHPAQKLQNGMQQFDDQVQFNYVLEIRLKRLEFKNHPLMTLENRLSKEMSDLVEMTNDRQRNNVISILKKKLENVKGEYARQKEQFVTKFGLPDVQYGGYVAGTSIPLEHQPESVSSSSALLSGPFSTSPAPSSPLRSPAKLSTSADNTADNTPVPSLPSSPIRRNLKTIFEVTKASGIPSFQLEFINREENTLRQERLTKMRRLKEIRDEIKNLRRLLDAEHHTDKLLQYRIMLTWEKLKSVRTVQGYTSTNSKLMIRRVENDKQADIDALRAEIKAEMKELKESNEMDYRLSVEEYFHKQHDYENTSRDTTENTVKLNDEVSFKTEHETEDSKADMEDRNLSEDKEKRRASETLKNRIKELSKKTNIQSTEELVDLDVPVETPSKPALAEFHASSVRKAIVERFNTSRRMPGTPSFYFRITEGEGITSDLQCPMSEQKRRRQIAATFFFLKLQYNGKLVTKTTPNCIDVSDFTLKLSNRESGHLKEENNITDGRDSDVIQLIVQEYPENITVDLWEQGVFGDRKICSLYIPPPLTHCHSLKSSDSSIRKDKDIGTLSPTSFEFASCLNESLTSNYPPDESLYKQLDAELFESELRNRKLPPTLNGLLKANVKWAVDEEGNTLGPTYDGSVRGEHNWIVNNSVKGAAPANIEKFKKWISAIDIHNPMEMTDELKQMKERLQTLNSIKSNRKVFRLSEGDNELILQEPDRENPKMRQLLQVGDGRHSLIRKSITSLRDSFHDMSFVPGEESENIGEVSKESSNICALDNSKQRVLKQRIRAQQLRRKGVLTPSSNVSEFVREVNLTLDVAKLTLWSTLFKERRPLRPEKRTRAVVVEAEIPRECMILIHVKRGMNVPIRKPDSGIVDVNNQKSSRVTVRPYLEVQFQRHVARTQVNEGPFPEWNETLSVPFALPNEDFRPESLQDICEDVHFNLFDEYVVDLIEDDRMREKNISVRKEKNWLGGFTVPLSAIYEQRQVQGTFHVKTPLLLFGYDKNSAEESSFKYFNLNIDKKNVSVDLYITIEPLLPLPKRFDCRFSSDEDDSLLRYATHWTSQLRNVSNNFVTPTVLDINGRTTFITRFIRPQIPPNEYTTLTQIVRFVSLIPTLSDRLSLATDSEVWSTSEQTFDIGAGGAPEHAILLTNYLVYLGKNAFVVLGHGNPDGRTAYVLVLEENNIESVFINPLNGDIYELRDPHCPLTSIGCVFNSANIYANIQRATGPHQLDFNLNDPRLWKPFLGSQYRLNTPLLSIQTETLKYQAISSTQLREISNLIETKLIESIESWRSRHLTRWNRLCNRIFSNLLQSFEKSYLSESPDSTFLRPRQHSISLFEDLENKQYAELIKLQSMYRFSGFPLNFKWTGNSDQIVDFVHATRIWDVDDSNVEFGLAVHCDGYVNGIASIWVYLACLGNLKRRD